MPWAWFAADVGKQFSQPAPHLAIALLTLPGPALYAASVCGMFPPYNPDRYAIYAAHAFAESWGSHTSPPAPKPDQVPGVNWAIPWAWPLSASGFQPDS